MDRRKFIKLVSILPLIPIIGNSEDQDIKEIPNYTTNTRTNADNMYHDDALDSYSYFKKDVLDAYSDHKRLGEIASKRMDSIFMTELKKFNG